MKRVVLEGEPFELSAADRGDLLGRRIAAQVQAHHDGRVSIARVVGHVSLRSGTTLCIRSSKSPAASVLAWMAFVDPMLRSFVLTDDSSGAAADGDIAALTARLFLRELRRAVSRFGVPRAYARTSCVSSVVKGRIDFARLADRAGDLSKLPCSTWERQPRSPVVRTLAAALEVVGRDSVMRHASPGDLMFLRSALADVVPQVDTGVLAGRNSLARNEAGFASPLALARLVLRRSLVGEGGDEAGAGYLINLEALFEATVVRALESARLPVRAKVPVEYQQLYGPQKKSPTKMSMEMDAYAPLVGGAGGLVVDAKYKRSINASNLQQVVTYAYVTGSSTAVLAVPAGFGAGPAMYRFAGGSTDSAIIVHVAELDTSGTNVAQWEKNAASLGAALRSLAS